MDAGTAIRRLVGGLLLAGCSLIALSCGLCTGYFGLMSVSMLSDPNSRGATLSIAPFLLAGLAATAVGIGLAWVGVRMVRGAGPASPEE